MGPSPGADAAEKTRVGVPIQQGCIGTGMPGCRSRGCGRVSPVRMLPKQRAARGSSVPAQLGQGDRAKVPAWSILRPGPNANVQRAARCPIPRPVARRSQMRMPIAGPGPTWRWRPRSQRRLDLAGLEALGWYRALRQARARTRADSDRAMEGASPVPVRIWQGGKPPGSRTERQGRARGRRAQCRLMAGGIPVPVTTWQDRKEPRVWTVSR
jgi:hypothetical protein